MKSFWAPFTTHILPQNEHYVKKKDTDELGAHVGLEELYEHEAVKHSAKEFVNHMAHTNGIENVWAFSKRGFNGVYHHWSKKHMRRYVNEFVFRLNEGNVRNHTMVRLDHIIHNAVGKRLTYEELTARQ